MDEIQDEIQDSNLEQETSTENEETAVEATADDDEAEVLKAKIADLEEKNKQLYARVKKEKPTLPTNQSSPDSDARFERLELKTEGYNSSEVDFLMQNGGRKALENKIVVAGIEAMRKEAKSKEATPSGTAKSAVYQKYTEQDLKRMSVEDLEKIIPQ